MKFSMSKGHNSVKNEWIKTKLELDLLVELGIAKPCTKYQKNICKQWEKKSGKPTGRNGDRQTQKKKAIVPSGYKPVGD